jgi:hypothetical protein
MKTTKRNLGGGEEGTGAATTTVVAHLPERDRRAVGMSSLHIGDR